MVAAGRDVSPGIRVDSTHDISNLGDRNSITPLLKADWYGPVS